MINANFNARSRPHSTLIIAIIFLIFAIPMALALTFYKKGDTGIESTVNRGTLIQPPQDLSKITLQNPDGTAFDQAQLRGKWLMLYVNPQSTCDALCQKNLYNMRQIRLATGKDVNRIQRAILTFSGTSPDPKLIQQLQTEYSGTIHIVTNKQQFANAMANLPMTNATMKQGQGYLCLVDPLGNIMMAYAPDANSSGIFKDVQRLLRISQIG